MRTKTTRTAEFSMSQLGADFSNDIANFAPYSPDNVIPGGGGAMGGKNYYFPSAAGKATKAVGNAAAGIGNTIKKAADSVGKQVDAAKNKVAVLVKGADGKVFVQQRWKNVQDVAGKAGAFVKANPGKTGLIVAGIGAAGYVGKNLLDADRESTQRLLKSKAFKDYAKSEGKFRERAKI